MDERQIPSKGSTEMTFDDLYQNYATDVLRVCYYYLGDRGKAEDVCQDVFVRYLTTSPELEPGKEKSWLLKVALNRCRDLWRSSWVKRVVLGSPLFETIPAPDLIAAREDEEALARAVHGLPAQFKEVVLLFYYQNYSVRDIAVMLNIPEGTVSSRLSRARLRLEECLKEGDA